MPNSAAPHSTRRSRAADALTIVGLDAEIELRRHPSARRLTLRISQTKRAVVVTIPARCRVDEASQFVRRNLDWVRERLGRLPDPVALQHGMSLPLRGTFIEVRFAPSKAGAPIVETVRLADGRAGLLVRGAPNHCARRLRDWLYQQAKADLDARVLHHARALGLKPRRIALRDQSSRWGSCSSNGVLSFSWRLILAPPLVLDYVAAHEVAHLAEMNHGPRFWALVRQTMPDMDKAKRWLLANGLDLHRYDANPDA